MASKLKNAPITEALIDLRVEAPVGTSMSLIDKLRGEVRDRYPARKRMMLFEGQMSIGDQVGASARQRELGDVFTSEDGKQIFQARMDGFTFSRLRPYGTWEELRDEAQRLWKIYKACVNPLKITRVAVRYVNRIDVPLAKINYEDYFQTNPAVSPTLPQGLSSFFMQLQFPQPDFAGLAILNLMATPPHVPGTTSVILDIDVFKEEPMGFVSESDAWELLEQLRKRKNEFFFQSLTQKALDLYPEEET